METKQFISVLKGTKTRYTNKPDAEKEKKAVENLVEKFGGKLEAVATLKEQGLDELKDYLKKVLSITSVVSTPSDNTVAKVISKDVDGTEFATKDGKVYKLDTVKKTMKRVYKDLSELNVEDVNLEVMPMTVYQRYLKDNFPGESATIKKGKLHFRDYRISCDAANGFMIEDVTKRYALVETSFEGIPTPKELGDWFKRPAVEHTPEELREAVKRGKELAKSKVSDDTEEEVENEEPDFEALRRKVLRTIKNIRSKTVDVDPLTFPDMIPFKRWRRKVKSLLTQWKDRKIRYAKFLNELEQVTIEETFEVKEKNHRSSFKGTLLPEFTEVGDIKGNKIEVDGKYIDAVPFLLEYLLHREYRAMSQIMKFAKGEITYTELIKNPLEQDWKVEYDKKALENTEFNVMVLLMVYGSLGETAPQEICYTSDLEEGDKIHIILDGTLRVKTVTSVDNFGVFLGKSVGYLLKTDTWVKIPTE